MTFCPSYVLLSFWTQRCPVFKLRPSPHTDRAQDHFPAGLFGVPLVGLHLGAVGLSVNLQESPSTSVHFCPRLLSSLPLLDCAGERRPFLCSRAASHPLWTWAGKGPFCHVKASHWGRPPLWFCYATPATGGSQLAYISVPSGRLGLGQLTGTEVASWP